MTNEYRIVATCKIGHHSDYSGYEQLIKYLRVDEKIISRRGPPETFIVKWFERILRRFSISRWYQMDGVQAEWAAVKARFRTGRPVMLHYLYSDGAIGFLPYLSKILDIRLIATIHGCPDEMAGRLRKRKALEAVSKFILLGSNQQAALKQLGISDRQIAVIPHGVNTSFFCNDRHARDSRYFDVLLVGNWRRNYSLYVEIFDRLQGVTEIRFILVTRHPTPASWQDAANLIIMRNISDDELLKIYQSSSCLLFAAEDAVANNVLLEAMSSGLPIVCEDVGAVREYLGDECSLYFRKNDPEDAVRKIVELFKDKKMRDNIGSYLSDKSRRFSWENIAKEVEKLYDTADA